MHAQDKALLFMSIAGLIISLVVFFIRRNAGDSRARATVGSIWSFGMTLALGFLFGFFPFKAQGMGLERIVAPFLTLFVTAIASAFFGMLIYFIEGRSAIKELSPLNKFQDPFNDEINHSGINKKLAPTNPNWPAWKQFAFDAARKPN